LSELAGVKERFKDPTKAQAWWREHKNDRWTEPYIGPHFRKKAAPAKAEEPKGGEKGPKEDEKRPEEKS